MSDKNENKNKSIDENTKNEENIQINVEEQLPYEKKSKLGILEIECSGKYGKELFSSVLKKYSINKERLLKDLLREQKILIDKNGLNIYQLSSFLNTLRKFYKKQDIEEVLKTKESNEQKPFEDSNDFLGCYCKQIKDKIKYFKPIGLANTLNGLAHLDVTREDLVVVLGGEDKLQSELLEPVCGQINKQINNFNLVDLANTLNGLVTIFLYDEKTPEKTKEIVLDCIKSILVKVNEMDKPQTDDKQTDDKQTDDRVKYAKYTLKKNLFYLENVLGLSLLDSNTKSNSLKEILVENTELNNSHMESTLEKEVEGFLKDKITGKEVPISRVDKSINYSHPVDFTFKYKGKTVYCEVDGPTHFVNFNQTEEDKNPQTKIRDQINEFIISKMGGNCIYVTVPANKCEEGLFFNYIDEKLKLEKSKEELDKPDIASTTDESKTANESKAVAWGKKTYYKPSSFSQILEKQQQSNNPNVGLSQS